MWTMANQDYPNALVASASWFGRQKILTIWGGVQTADLFRTMMGGM